MRLDGQTCITYYLLLTILSPGIKPSLFFLHSIWPGLPWCAARHSSAGFVAHQWLYPLQVWPAVVFSYWALLPGTVRSYSLFRIPLYLHNIVGKAVRIILVAVVYAQCWEQARADEATRYHGPEYGVAIIKQIVWRHTIAVARKIKKRGEKIFPVVAGGLSLGIVAVATFYIFGHVEQRLVRRIKEAA